MLQIGKYTAPQDGRPAIIQREFYGQGYIFKDEAAFLSHPDQVCYVMCRSFPTRPIPTTTCWPCATGRKSWRSAASTA